MGEPAVRLTAVGEATEQMHGVTKQALEWVRIGEERAAEAEKAVVAAEARATRSRAEVKERARTALSKIGEEGRERIAAEGDKRRAAQARVARAEEGRDRAEKAFEGAVKRAEADRGAMRTRRPASKRRTEQGKARAGK